jgi:hypothetical protein
MWEPTDGIYFCGVNRKLLNRSSNLEIMSYGFLEEKKHILANSKKDSLVHLKYIIVYLIIFFFLFLLTNFEPNPILINVNKLKHTHMWIKH